MSLTAMTTTVATTTNRIQFLDLPPELILHALALLSPQDLLACQLTNKYLHRLVQGSVLLQYNMALSAARAEDNPCSILPLSEKLEALKMSEDAWSFLRPKFTLSIPVTHNPSGIYDLTGGVYLLGNFDRKALHYLKLPTKEDDDTSWNKIEVDKTIIDMGLCVFEHDLIAIVTTHPHPGPPPATYDIELVLREFSTGKLHPQAKEERILVMNSQYEKPAIGIEIVGDNLVLILTFHHDHTPEDRVFIYEWRTAALKASFSAPYRTYSGLLFLTEHLVLFPNTQTNVLEIFRIPSKPTVDTLTPVLSLALPTLTDGRVLGGISCRAEPNPIGAASRLDKRQRAKDRAEAGVDDVDGLQPKRGFLASSEEAICVFALRVLGVPMALLQGGVNLHFQFGRTFTFFIHRRSFVELVRKYEKEQPKADLVQGPSDGQKSDETFPKIPWEQWGPTVSRWFNADTLPTRWITTTAGQRCVLIADSAPESGFPYVVLDFNNDNVKKMKKWLKKQDESPRQSEEEVSEDVDHSGMAVDDEGEWEPGLFTPAFPDNADTIAEMDDDADALSDTTEEEEDSSQQPSRIWCVDTSEKVESPETFAEPVECSLPYVACASEGRYPFDGVLLDEERVIGIRTDMLDRIKYVDVHYFG